MQTKISGLIFEDGIGPQAFHQVKVAREQVVMMVRPEGLANWMPAMPVVVLQPYTRRGKASYMAQ